MIEISQITLKNDKLTQGSFRKGEAVKNFFLSAFRLVEKLVEKK